MSFRKDVLRCVRFSSAVVCLAVFSVSASADRVVMRENFDWETFLGRHELRWDRLPETWGKSPFLGNGLLGLTVHGGEESTLRWNIGRSDVSDHRNENSGKKGVVFDRARLPIGHFNFDPVGVVKRSGMQLDLWNAQLTADLETDEGTIRWRAFAHADLPVIVIDFKTTGGESAFSWQWEAEKSMSPRGRIERLQPEGYEANPPAVMEQRGDVRLSLQPLLAGGGYVAAWRNVRSGPNRRTVYISVGNAWRVRNGHVRDGAEAGIETASAEAVRAVRQAAEEGVDELLETHRRWWHAYYPQSFVSVPDPRIESFYWIQMYKLGSATRADGPSIDLLGPWITETIWPAVWCNLNLQLIYSPVYTANRLEQGESFCRMFHANRGNLRKNLNRDAWRHDSDVMGRVSSFDCRSWMENQEKANLFWICHNYWKQCKYAADYERMRDELFPLLKRAVNYYLHLVEKGEDGKWHTPVSMSPEYPGKGPDCNYDLALFRWACRTLIEIDNRFALNDALKPRWKDMVANLVDYPVDENGLMVARGVSLEKTHRHYSHLLMIYPLHTMNIEQPEHIDLMNRSLDHWIGQEGRHTGYTYSGAASIAATLGRSADVLPYLNQALNGRFSGIPNYVSANTMYIEGGNPVMETPLSAAQSVHDVLLQSWGGKIRVFPAIPEAWPDAAFRDLRAEGAFLVSAVRRHGRTQWVRVKSLAGEPCVVKPALKGDVQSTVSMNEVEDGVYRLDLSEGEEAFLYAGRRPDAFRMAPLPRDPAACYHYGTRAARDIAEMKKGSQ